MPERTPRRPPTSQTLHEIAVEHNRPLANVRKWTNKPWWPESDGTRQVGRAVRNTYPRAKVREAIKTHARAARNPLTREQAANLAKAAAGDPNRLTIVQIAARHGVTVDAINQHIRRHRPGESKDPYPPSGPDGLRDVKAVDAWHKRHRKPGMPAGSVAPHRIERPMVLEARARIQQRGEPFNPGTLAKELDIPREKAATHIRKLRAYEARAGASER